jgi:hypothetical protein
MSERARDGERPRPTPKTPAVAKRADGQAGDLHALQRTAGNRAVQRRLAVQRQGRRTKTVTFDEAEEVTGTVTRVAAGDSAAAVTGSINEIVGLHRAYRTDLGTSWLGAIERFETFMQFPADAEAEAKYLSAALKFAGKKVLDHLLAKMVEPLKALGPGVGTAVDLTFGFVEAMKAEYERAEAAAGQIKIRDAIAGMSRQADGHLRSLSGSIDQMPQLLEQGYRAAVAGGDRPTGTGTATAADPAGAQPATATGPGAITPGSTTLTGPGAEFLVRARRAATQMRATQPSLDTLLQGILTRWVLTREDSLESLGGGAIYQGGRIYLSMKISKDGDRYTIAEPPTRGRLASPEASKTASALTNSLRGSNRTINDLPILKILRIEIEDEVWGFNDTYRTTLSWRSPGDIISVGPHWGPRVDEEYLAKARVIGPRALELVRPADLRINQLEAYD